MRKDIFQMSALNNKQMWLCDIFTRLPLIKYREFDEDGVVNGHLLESPITGKPLDVWWWVESWSIVHTIFIAIWNSPICMDKEAQSHLDELFRLGWVHIDKDESA